MRRWLLLKKRNISNGALDSLNAETVFDADGETMQGAYYLLLPLQVFIQELRAPNRFLKPMFC